MREQLLGYLLDAIEPDERERLEDQLRRDPDLQRELELMDDALEPLRIADVPIDPPADLAERTSRMVAAYRSGKPITQTGAPVRVTPALIGDKSTEELAGDVGRRKTLADMAVAGGLVVAATLLLFPAIQQSRAGARLNQCQNNLRQIGLALAHYCMHNQGYYPPIGSSETAGIYAAYLQQGGYVHGRGWNLCPASAHATCSGDGYVPTFEELRAASGPARIRLQRGMGGGYGYTLHYVENGVYRCLRRRDCATLAVMADVPSGQLSGLLSANHGGCGQNVLYDDGHVRCLCRCTAEGGHDHIFLNSDGLLAPGTHAGDAVIASSDVIPVVRRIRPRTDLGTACPR